MANLTRLRNIIHVIETNDNPELKFNMNWWMKREPCGTTMCFAGWAAHVEKLPVEFKFDWANRDVAEWFNDPVTGERTDIESWAARYFEITEDQAFRIFHFDGNFNDEDDSFVSDEGMGGVTVDDLKERINQVLEEKVFI